MPGRLEEHSHTILDTVIVIDGAPIVTDKKVEALTKVLRKLFAEAGRVREDGIYMPMGEDGKSKGYLFVTFETSDQAENAIRLLNNRRLDNKHTLLANWFSDIEEYGEDEEEDVYEEPPEEPYVEQEYLRSWLKEPNAVDQLVLFKGETVAVYWNRKSAPPESIVARPNWTERNVVWSPLGTYLCSVHQQGIQFWGGEGFSRKARLVHPGVQLLDFSPCENYLVTWSPEPIQLIPDNSPMRAAFKFTAADEGKQIVVWNLKTGMPVRTFSSTVGIAAEGGPSGPQGPKKISWPAFKWSNDDKYLARVIPGQQIFVYETPGLGLLDKKSIKIEGVVDFEFSPSVIKGTGKKGAEEHVISYWTPEVSNQSARVTLMTIPSKEVIRTRNLFNVADCRLHWQSKGEFLCVKVVRFTKTKKATFTNLEFFRLREKNIPIEVVELKETVINFAWEPSGDRLVFISTIDTPAPPAVAAVPPGSRAPFAKLPGLSGVAGPTKTTVCFYGLERSKGSNGQFRQISSVERKSANSIFWSPKGRFVVVAGVGGTSTNTGELDFWDFDFEGEKQEVPGAEDVPANLMLMATGQHYQLTDIAWDPTGRYVATSSSTWGRAMETGYRIWDLRGVLLREEHVERFKQFLWRPRPPTLLTPEQQREVKKNLREYSRIFEQEDLAEESQASKELVQQRLRLLEEWRAWRKSIEAEIAAERNGVVPLSLQRSGEKEGELIEEIVEEVVFEKEEEIDS